MSRVHNVRPVLDQFVDALDDVPLSEHDFVPHGHEPVFHVGPDTVYEVYALLEEFFLDISPVGEHLPVEVFNEYTPHPVIHICPCKAEGYHIPRIVAQQVQLETVTPAYCAFSVLGQPRENFVHVPPAVVAYGNHGAVHECDAAAFPEGVQFYEKHHRKEHSRHQFDKAVV